MKNAVKLLSIMVLLFVLAGCDSEVHNQPTEVYPVGIISSQIDLLQENLNTRVTMPRISWQLSEKIKYQDSYRIVLFQSLRDAEKGVSCYDSGWIKSSQETNVPIEYPLSFSKLYYYQIYVKDERDNYYCSERSSFLTELQDTWSDTDLVWTKDPENRHNIMVTPLNVNDHNIDRVFLHATGVGNNATRQQLFDIFIGENYIGCGPTRETVQEENSVIFYQSWDITDHCSQEENVLTFVNYAEDDAKGILFQIVIHYKDGRTKTFFNSACDSTQIRVYDSSAMYSGNIGTGYFRTEAENLDGRFLNNGWDMTDKDISSWETAVVQAFPENYQIKPYQSENVYRYEKHPQKVEVFEDGHYIIDFGREIIGSFCLKVEESKGGVVSIYLGEELNEDGTVKYQMRTANNYALQWQISTEKNHLESLNVMGFRYVELVGCPFEVTTENVFAHELRQDFDDAAAKFDCSNELLNDIYSLIQYSIKATNQSVLVDSQTRERAPYEGDAYVNSLASYMVSNRYSLTRFTQQWLIENRTWPAEYVYLSPIMMWTDYLYTGDSTFMGEYYDILTEGANRTLYLEKFDEEIGLFKGFPDEGWDRVLVDWPETEREGFEYCPYNTAANSFAYAAFDALDRIAQALDKSDDQWAYYRDRIGASMIQYLYDEDAGAFCDGMNEQMEKSESHTYHATVYVMWSGMLDASPQVLDACREYVSEMEHNCFSVYGTFYLLDALCRYDMTEQALSILTETEDIRSYYHLIYELGVTLTPEAWDPSIKDNMTYSHAWSGGGIYAIISGLIGINPIEPGFEQFTLTLKPELLEEFSVLLPTVRGTIEVSCEEKDSVYHLQLTVPGNTTCILRGLDGWTVQHNDNNISDTGEIVLNAGTIEIQMKKAEGQFLESA